MVPPAPLWLCPWTGLSQCLPGRQKRKMLLFDSAVLRVLSVLLLHYITLILVCTVCMYVMPVLYRTVTRLMRLLFHIIRI